MNTAAPLRIRLKEQTLAAHQKIEQNPVLASLLAPTLTRERYCAILQRYFGFFRPLERELASLTKLRGLIPNFEARRRTPDLIRDLEALGLTATQIAALPDCERLPALQGSELELEARFLGITYVLEGSTLGGAMMAKRLSKHEFLPSGSLHFLSGHGPQTGSFWQSYLQVLETTDQSAAARTDPLETEQWRQLVTTSAQATFETMDHWMGGR